MFTTAIPIDYATPLLQDLAALGSDVEALWVQAEIDTPLDSALSGAMTTLPTRDFTRLYRGCMEELERRACHREIAEQLLHKPGLGVEDIAERLGFGSDRAFRRAFQAWTGHSPSAFRERSQGRSASL